MKPFVLLVAGSRHLPYPEIVGPRIATLAASMYDRPLVVRHGACPGERSTDTAAADWIHVHGEDLGITDDPHPADWDLCAPECPTGPGHRRTKRPGDIYHPGRLSTYCPGAGPRRNIRMVNLGADLMYAWPNGPSYGTRGCMRLARAAGIEVQEQRLGVRAS